MELKPLRGVFPLMPFVLDEEQNLDVEGLKENIRIYEQAGVQGFVAFGCMGECYASSYEEFQRVVDTAMESRRSIAAVFGVTYHNTRECVRRAQYAERQGADGIMVGPPYLIPCTDEAVVTHFREINDSLERIQVMAYNNPFSFRVHMTRSTWDRLMTLERIKALKESADDAMQRAHVISHISSRINVFSGTENWFLPDSLVGATGIIGVVAPGALRASLRFYEACMNRDLERAIPMHIEYNDLVTSCTVQNEVGWFKACAELGGVKAGRPRDPYAPLDQRLRDTIKGKLAALSAMAG
jgi:dihydrodipicolinate synthase/N-acetylneuraminate lyase